MGPIAIMMAAGAVTGAAGSLLEGQAAKAAGKHNEKLARVKANLLRQQAQRDAQLASVNARKMVGDMRANYAASGVRLEGSPLDVMEESVRYAQEDILNIKNQGELNARISEYEGKIARMGGNSAATASGFSAASTLTSGFAKAAEVGK